MPAAAQRTAGGVFLTFPEDLRPLSAIDYIMYCHSRYVPTLEVGGAEKRLSSPEKRLTAPAKYAILPSALMLVWLSWQSSSLVMSRSPVRIRPQAPKSNSREGVAFLFETTNRCVMHETPISDHNRWYMHNYHGEISFQKGTSSPKRCLLSNAVAGCRTKMLVFDKLPLHLLSVCGIFDSVKAVRGVYMGNCVPLKLC